MTEPGDPSPGTPPGGLADGPGSPPYRVDYGSSEPHRLALVAAMAAARLTREQLWVRAFGLGAQIGLADVEAYLEGLMPLPDPERDVLAHAMNERLAELAGPEPVPYSRSLSLPRPDTGPLAALTTLLEGARYCPPERLPLLATAAAEAVGVRGATIHLVDYEQRRLTALTSPPDDRRTAGRDARASVPAPPPTPAEPASVPVEGSMAGRAFRTGRTVSAVHDAPPRYWVPVLDSDERLGVLEVELHSMAQLDDPHLREQCGWLGALFGHLISGLDRHGDAVTALRRGQARTAGAELIWGLLPPLTAGVRDIVVSGLLAPADDLGGDVFDYALSRDTASLAVFDAMGHGIGAGVTAAAAVSTYRAARRAGLTLPEQAAAVDDTVATLFPDAYVTGVLVEVDLPSGQVTYLNAGHPRPLLLRTGSVVGTLVEGTCLPLGLHRMGPPSPRPDLGHVTLEPGDWLALHTDGVTEARSTHGTLFGEARLADHLVRAAADDQPPPETVRRLLATVLAHQDGILQDDATLLLARWRTAAAAPRSQAGPRGREPEPPSGPAPG